MVSSVPVTTYVQVWVSTLICYRNTEEKHISTVLSSFKSCRSFGRLIAVLTWILQWTETVKEHSSPGSIFSFLRRYIDDLDFKQTTYGKLPKQIPFSQTFGPEKLLKFLLCKLSLVGQQFTFWSSVWGVFVSPCYFNVTSYYCINWYIQYMSRLFHQTLHFNYLKFSEQYKSLVMKYRLSRTSGVQLHDCVQFRPGAVCSSSGIRSPFRICAWLQSLRYCDTYCIIDSLYSCSLHKTVVKIFRD